MQQIKRGQFGGVRICQECKSLKFCLLHSFIFEFSSPKRITQTKAKRRQQKEGVLKATPSFFMHKAPTF